jgi:signal transduction histidine kinase
VKVAWPRWHYLYFALAAFDVFAVSAGLYATHSIVHIYTASVAKNHAWAERTLAYSYLGELAAAVNAPGNNVFDTYDVHAESARMKAALQRFHQGFARMRRDLEMDPPGPESRVVLAYLDAVGAAVDAMSRDARGVFASFEQAPMHAGVRMASMDQRYAEVNQALGDLRQVVASVQQRNFEEQTAAALALEQREYFLATLVLLMVAGATIYGRRLSRRVQSDFRDKERHLRELALSRTRLEERSMQLQLSNGLLNETCDRLQALLRRMLASQEAQRQHVARELHEDVAQVLASLRMRLGALEMAPGIREHAQPHVKDASTLAERALHRLQSLVRQLTPHGMESIGLAGVLTNHLEEWTRGTGLTVEFTERLPDRRPRFPVETAAYRVAEEAVANAVLHAQAQKLRVELIHADGELHVRVQDDGVGFDVPSVRRHATDDATGITLMEQRTTAEGGCLEIVSAPKRGTTVRASFPAG